MYSQCINSRTQAGYAVGEVLKVVIVGAGVMGLLQARRLANQGKDVVLIEKGELGREASWAGGGIISPLYPWRYCEAVTALASRSQALYPDLIRAIHDESGVDPEYSPHGLLMLNVDDERRATQWSEQNGAWMSSIDAEQLYSLEPELAKNIDGSLWMPKVGSIRNPRLLKALKTIVTQHQKIKVLEHAPVANILERKVVLESGSIVEGDIVVVCSGAWSPQLLPDVALDIKPVKGQMVVFDAPKGLVNRVVLSGGRYVIPRQDGKVVAGSTLEHTAFDKQTTQDAKASLIESAVQLFPKLKSSPVIHHWAGLRPGSPKGIPSIGQLPGYTSVYINAGHYRNGLVLAPASVELLGNIIDKQCSDLNAKPYSVA